MLTGTFRPISDVRQPGNGKGLYSRASAPAHGVQTVFPLVLFKPTGRFAELGRGLIVEFGNRPAFLLRRSFREARGVAVEIWLFNPNR